MTRCRNSEEIQQKIQAVIDGLGNDSDRFADVLREEAIPHLSYSQISTVEFCQHRYWLQYICMQPLEPVPEYFTKGRLFHQCLASFYRAGADPKNGSKTAALQMIADSYDGDHQLQLRNAFHMHLENCWQDCEVVAVEKAFSMIIDPALPPIVGVIDLIVRQRSKFILVDHKTGRNFVPQDELQMMIYVEYIRREYGNVDCEFYYDHYRWVNHLERIRKPAFQRECVHLNSKDWTMGLSRIQRGYEQIELIRKNNRAPRAGKCFCCPYHGCC